MSISVLLLADITGKITALIVEDVFGVIINRPFDGIIYIAYCVVISRSLSGAAANVWNVKTKKR